MTSLALVFVVAGLTLLATGLTLTRRVRRFQKAMRALLQLASQDLEPLDIPPLAWPVLARAGWQQLACQGHWFGHPVQLDFGSAPAVAPVRASDEVGFQIRSGDDVQLSLRLTCGTVRGERRVFAEQLAQVFVLLLETALRSRTEALSAALAERARLTLYVQHDMRNLAQWVQWISADFAACTSDETLLLTAMRLRANAPLAQERAQRLTQALGKQPVADRARLTDLRQALLQAAHLAGVQVQVSGEASAWIAPGALARALDNLFSNLAGSWREGAVTVPSISLAVRQAESCSPPHWAEIDFFSPWPDARHRLTPDKLFEPFASGRPGGLGLGLYQARKSLREAGAELLAQTDDDGLRFVLHLPLQAPMA